MDIEVTPPTQGASNDTWWIKPHDGVGKCEVREMDHFGKLGTGFLWCGSHGEIAGEITYANKEH